MFAIILNLPAALNKLIYCTILIFILFACSKEPERKIHSENFKNDTIVNSQNDFRPLKDTGIKWAGKSLKHNQENCSSEPNENDVFDEKNLTIYQDCMHGADQSGAVANYQKISAAGETLDATAITWACVFDKSTGLLWENKIPMNGTYGDNGLQDSDDVFTWYSNNSSQNGGAIGDWSQGLEVCASYQKDQPTTFCNTEELTRRVNEKGLCGFKDWRLPNRFELESLVSYGNKGLRIDAAYFPGTNPEFYWSSTPGAANSGAAWAVNFRTGNTSLSSRQSSFPVRLVCSAN